VKRNFFIGIAISAFFIYLIFRKIDFKQLIDAFQSANYLIVLPTFLIFVVSLIIRAFRWRYLVNPVKEKIGVTNLFSALSIGFMVNMLLPGRIGEFVRAFVLGYKEKISKSASFATIVVERLIDGFTILALLIVIATLVHFPEESGFLAKYLKLAGYLSFLFYIIVLGILIFIRSDRLKVVSIIQVLFFFLPHKIKAKLLRLIDSFASGLGILGEKKDALPILFSSCAVWFCIGVMNYLVFLAFHLKLPFYAPLLLIVFQAVGVMIPSPGFIGPFHAASIYGMTFFGVSKEVAISAAFLMHAGFFFPTVAVGFIFLWKENLSFSRIKDMERDQKEET
jgi:uncharacterized protein (TIRG00374 family)